MGESLSTHLDQGGSGGNLARTTRGRGKIASDYENLIGPRSSVLARARDAAELTIPSLLPRSGSGDVSELHKPNQSLGARGVTNLSAKLMLALFPPNRAFFRFGLGQDIMDEVNEAAVEGGPNVGDFELALARSERTVIQAFESTGSRQAAFVAVQYLIVAGNVVVKVQDDNSMRLFRLDQYVMTRDSVGNVKKIITQENVAWENLPLEIQKKVPKPKRDTSNEATAASDGNRLLGEDLDIFTEIKFKPENKARPWSVRQEIEGKIVTRATFKVNPYIALRWIGIPGEDYGRSHVEENIGDLTVFDQLARAIVDAAAAAARILILRNPAGVTKAEDLSKAENGDVIDGRPDDVKAFQLEKSADMRVAAATADALERRVSIAFLLNTGLQRSGDRVTATEIRTIAQELEGTLGGVFSNLASEFQVPYLERVVQQLQAKNKLAKFPEGTVDFEILTGLEALGREQDLVQIQTAAQLIATLPDEAKARVNWGEFVNVIFAGLNIENSGFVKTDEQMEKEQQQQQAQLVAQQGLAAAAEQGGATAGENLANQATAPEPEPIPA